MSKRKISKKGLIKKLQSLMREIVILRDKECVTCPIWREMGKWQSNTNVLQAGHYFSRGAKSIKYDLRNVHLQCRTCNARHRFQPEAFTIYLNRKFGKDWMEQLIKDKYKLAPQIENMGSLYQIEMILKDELERQKEEIKWKTLN